jgi:mitotic spindle assembly checkpoint protein MAD2
MKKQNINIKGSSKIVSEFFCYAVQAILYQRGVYPADQFEKKNEYDSSLQVFKVLKECSLYVFFKKPLITKKESKLRDYLNVVLAQVDSWAAMGSLQQLVMVIARAETGETIERWVFNVETDKAAVNADSTPVDAAPKTVKEVRNAIAAIMRQIASR